MNDQRGEVRFDGEDDFLVIHAFVVECAPGDEVRRGRLLSLRRTGLGRRLWKPSFSAGHDVA
ncbi:hypothetical protein M2271_008516 [Streptomyces sp. LBL]|uniref:hypothetical protein n=1 Tax=Streptomyces sp. LBL TaxID=2940562 RepID=UPI0024758671|nr:hypothetical protein [Streptomyces sp. LBL]MDH6630655.1 hypothetical protein [Streptomyces sp. LBL]